MFDIINAALEIGSGTLWSLTYMLIIQRGYLDRTYGMPLVALCTNVSWEFIFAFVHPHGSVQGWVNTAWFLLDLIIVYQLLKYGPREFGGLPRSNFYAMFGLALGTSFCAILFMTQSLDEGTHYSAFGQNLLMSVLFITMLYSRRSLRGQSLSIAILKMLGTVLASAILWLDLYTPNPDVTLLLLFLSAAILVYDTIYAILVWTQRKAGNGG